MIANWIRFPVSVVYLQSNECSLLSKLETSGEREYL